MLRFLPAPVFFSSVIRGLAALVQPWVRSVNRRRLAIAGVILLTILPVVYVLAQTAGARRGIVYWDEFDTALALVLKLKEGMTAREFATELFSLSNEHRIVTSRLLYASCYWLTGRLDFTLIDVIGKGSLLALCLLLVATAGSVPRRLQLGLILAFAMFQLEQFENFLWSGSSIDHFLVVMIAAAAIVALARPSRAGLFAGAGLATLATFTLAQGLAVWPVGATMLWLAGRRRDTALWCAWAALVAGGFFHGFAVNRAEIFVGVTLAGGQKIVTYWLSILGAAPALGYAAVAPWFGGALLGLLFYLVRRGVIARERIALPLAGFALAAAALIAVGRAEHSAGVVYSRYYVLSTLAWALALFMLIGTEPLPRWPRLGLAGAGVLLGGFNLAANHEFSDDAESWLNCRDLAVASFKQHGVDGRGQFRLHPDPDRATELLQRAEAAGVYRLAPICRSVDFPRRAQENGRISYFVEELATNEVAASVRGWAAIPGHTSHRGTVHVVLRSPQATHVFSSVTVPRADVPTVMRQPGWTNAGFHFARRLDNLPSGEFQVGLLIIEDDRADYVMTDHRLKLLGAGHKQTMLAEQ